jgi:hypothetical protein
MLIITSHVIVLFCGGNNYTDRENIPPSDSATQGRVQAVMAAGWMP